MKKLLSFAACLLVSSFIWSQDVLTLHNGEEVEVKVVEISATELKYKKFENVDGPIYSMGLKNIYMIVYENGTKDVFNSTKIPDVDSPEDSFDSFARGQNDARVFYKSYRAASTSTLLTTILFTPLVGLVPAVACSLTPPSEDNLDYPNYEKMKNVDYRQGYKTKAHKIKSSKVWMNWGIGFGVNVAVLLLLL
ncbi:MAG: hypothetical protein RBS19_10755 [Bacteroidales bacterium]|nr:hypothetical protein [Bacteroidales bacterium]